MIDTVCWLKSIFPDLPIGPAGYDCVVRRAFAFFQQGGPALTIAATALFGLLAWIGKSIVSWAVDLRAARKRRHELMSALRSDVAQTVDNLKSSYGADEERSQLEIDLSAKFDDAKSLQCDFIPFSAVTKEDFIMDLVKPEFTSLPSTLMAPLTRYYYLGQIMVQCVLDFRTEAYALLEIERKKAFALYTFDLARQRYKVSKELLSNIDEEFAHTTGRANLIQAAMQTLRLAGLGIFIVWLTNK